jgi:ferredoxin-NADP reductase
VAGVQLSDPRPILQGRGVLKVPIGDGSSSILDTPTESSIIYYNDRMKTLHVPLLRREEIAENTYAFYFPKEDFSYHAGQYISLCVEKPEIAAPGGTMRELSLSSAPYENELATALRFRESLAKKQFLTLHPGDMAYIQGPFGSFQLEKTEKPIIFLAGGIGITPLLGMLKQALYEKWQNKFFIFFSNRRPEDIPYRDELDSIVKKNKNTTLITTLTLERPTSWNGEYGYINPAMIKKHFAAPKEAYYYLSGPQRFIGGMWEMLDEIGVHAKQIHGEEFTGY